MKRLVVLGFGAFAYVSFLGVFAVLVDFLVNAGFIRGIDHGPAESVPVAVAINLALVALFGVSHSVLARPAVKARCEQLIPQVLERSTYVLVANGVLALMVWQWRSLPDSIWSVTLAPVRVVIWALFGGGIALVIVATFLTDHFDLFGLRQVWLYARGKEYAPVPFRMRGLYKWIRHPMMLGIFAMLWATPSMSVGHLLFAVGMSVYIVVGVAFEERALLRSLGKPYEEYRRRVRAFLPSGPSRRP